MPLIVSEEDRPYTDCTVKNTLVLYHKNCTDGFGAAWSAWKKLGDSADYLPVAHQEPLPEVAQDRQQIYMLDFCYSEEVTRELIIKNHRVTAMEHHAMREPAAHLTEGGVFDNARSGATITWGHFHPETPMPTLLKYVEDNDLWKHALPHTKEIFSYIDIIPQEFEAWNALAHEMENDFAGCVSKGTLLLKNDEQLMSRIIRENAEEVLFEGHRVLAVNSPCFRSDIGHIIATKQPPFGIIWDKRKGKTVVSLRAEGSFNVAALAAKYGGGGHVAAAGFTILDGTPIPWKAI